MDFYSRFSVSVGLFLAIKGCNISLQSYKINLNLPSPLAKCSKEPML